MKYHTIISASPNLSGEYFIELIGGPENINFRDEEGYSPIEAAIMANNAEIAQAIIDTAGFDIEARNGAGFTPLNLAAQSSTDATILKLLLNNGASPNTEDDFGNTPMNWALQKHNWHDAVPDFGSVVKEKLSALLSKGAHVSGCYLDILSEQIYDGKDEIQQWLEQSLAGIALDFLE